jgi:predicted transcriptional regulator
MGATQEAGMVQMKTALAGLPVGSVMITDFRTVEPAEKLQRAVEQILAGCQQDFPVVEDSRVVGVLTRADVLAGLAKHGASASVADAMQREICTAEPTEMVETVWSRLDEGDCRTLPVLCHGELVGILNSENLGEYIMIQTALDESSRGGRRERRQTSLQRSSCWG